MEEKRIKTIRKIFAIVLLILLILSFVKLLPIFMDLTTEEGRIAFETKIESLGIKGAISIIILQILKIILVFLPGEPIELLAGMCFGPWIGMLIIYIGVILSNFLIIFLVKKYGVSFVKDVVSEKNIEKVEKIIGNNPGKTDIILFILYYLPILPKDFITYIASLLPLTKTKVMFLSILGRFPAVFSSVLVGSKILVGDIKSIILIYLTTYIISGIIAMIYKKNFSKDERKEQNDG